VADLLLQRGDFCRQSRPQPSCSTQIVARCHNVERQPT
jgi:hypothetical protein